MWQNMESVFSSGTTVVPIWSRGTFQVGTKGIRDVHRIQSMVTTWYVDFEGLSNMLMPATKIARDMVLTC